MKPRAIVCGAGIVGSACALELARMFEVLLIDEGSPAPSASMVAAGMLAPALEAAADPLSPPFDTLKEARERWPEFAKRIGAPAALHRSGALWCAMDDAGLPRLAQVSERLRSAGAAFEAVSWDRARAAQPMLAPSGSAALWTPEDWRLDVQPMAGALDAALRGSGVTRLSGLATAVAVSRLDLHDGRSLEGDLVVLAPGIGGRALRDHVPELSVLQPIKGQIVRFHADDGEGARGPMVRSARGYLVPSADGLAAGATMEAGADDCRVDAEAVAGLRRAATELAPHLAYRTPRAQAGVRAATPDGAPLVGWSQAGVLLATGARRNGWLLAPLIAAVVARLAEGGDADGSVHAWRPARFG